MSQKEAEERGEGMSQKEAEEGAKALERERAGENVTPEIRALAHTLDLHPYWVENLLSMHPVLKGDDDILLGMFRIDGALAGWVTSVDEAGGIWRNEEYAEFEEAENWHKPLDAIRLASHLIGKGWMLVVYSREQMDEIKKHIAYSQKAKAKSYRDMTEKIAAANIVVAHDGTPCTTAEQVWNALPKELFALRLAEWYAVAVAKDAA